MYIPTTEVIRADWIAYRTHGAPMTRMEMAASFDRWFLQEIERAEYSGYLRAVREGLHR